MRAIFITGWNYLHLGPALVAGFNGKGALGFTIAPSAGRRSPSARNARVILVIALLPTPS